MNRPAVHCSIHLDIEPGHFLDGCEAETVVWSRSTYLYDFAPGAFIVGTGGFGKMIPVVELLPSWVPRPPAAWLAISEELLDAALDAADEEATT